MKRARFGFKSVITPLLLGVLGWSTVTWGQASVVRIGVPDTSVGGKPSSTGLVDILTAQRTFERALEPDAVKVEWIFFKGAGPAINEALANEQVDLAYMGDLPALVGRAQGLRTQLLSANRRNVPSYLAVSKQSGIKTLADLRGRTISVFRGTVLQLSLSQALESQGLTERDVKGVSLDLNAATAALASGNVDAVWGTSNLLSLQDKGLADVVLSTRDINNTGSYSAVLVGRTDYVKDNPALIEKIKLAQRSAYDWLLQPGHKQAYLDTLVKNGFPQSVVDSEFKSADFTQLFSIELDDQFLRDLQARITFAKKIRLIRKDFTVEEWLKG